MAKRNCAKWNSESRPIITLRSSLIEVVATPCAPLSPWCKGEEVAKKVAHQFRSSAA